jgi:Domain of unknown function (DUF4440)
MRSVAAALVLTLAAAVATAAPGAIADGDARTFVQVWATAQNAGDFAAYSALYAPAFKGIRRSGTREVTFDRAGWLADRQRMFKKKMTVELADVRTFPDPAGARVTFNQTFRQGRYADFGTKELLLARVEGRVVVTREEMLASSLPPPAPPADWGKPGEAPTPSAAVGVKVGDVQAITPTGLVKYDGHKPCGKTPVPFSGVEIEGAVSEANGTDRMSIVVRGTHARIPGPGGSTKCDAAHLEPLGESWIESDVPGKTASFRQRISAPRGDWPCALSVEVKILRGGQPVAQASRSLALGACAK